MPPVSWETFESLPGGAELNFEMLCRALIRRHYGRYGDFAALANQTSRKSSKRMKHGLLLVCWPNHSGWPWVITAGSTLPCSSASPWL